MTLKMYVNITIKLKFLKIFGNTNNTNRLYIDTTIKVRNMTREGPNIFIMNEKIKLAPFLVQILLKQLQIVRNILYKEKGEWFTLDFGNLQKHPI